MKEITELFTQASDYESMGDLKSAINIYNKILEIDISNYDAKTNRSLILKKLGELDGSMNDDNEEIELKGDASSYESWPDRIEVTDSTFEGLNKDCELNPNAQAYFKRGLTKLLINEFEDAIPDFDKTLELDQYNYKAYNNRGVAKFEILTGYKKSRIKIDSNDCWNDFTEAIRLNNNDSIAYFNRAYSSMRLNFNKDGIVHDFDKAIEINPHHTKAYYEKGQYMMDEGDYPNAIKCFNEVIEINPFCKDVYYDLKDAYLFNKQYSEVIRTYTELIRIDPFDEAVYSNFANYYYKIGNFNQADIYYTKAIGMHPFISQNYHSLGIVKIKLHKYNEAIDNFTSALQKSTYKLSENFFNRGLAKHITGDYEGALGDINNSLKYDTNQFGKISDSAVPYFLLGIVKFNLGSTEEAKNHLEEAIAKNEDEIVSFYTEDEIIDYECAIRDFSKVIEIKPEWEYGYIIRGINRCNLLQNTDAWRNDSESSIKLWKLAFEDFTKAIDVNPNNPIAYIERAKVSNSEQSEKDLLKAIELDPENPVILCDVAKVKDELYGTESTTDYLKALRTGIKKNNNAVINFAKDSLAYLYNNALLVFLEDFIKNKYDLDDPEYKELVDRLDIEFSELIELCPTWDEPYFNRGYLRIESLHDYHGAINDYDKYIELQPYYGLAYYNRGEAKFKLGDSDGAKVDFMKAKKLGIDEKYEYYGDESSIAM